MRHLILVLFCIGLVQPTALAGPGNDLALIAADIQIMAIARANDTASHPSQRADELDMDDPFLAAIENFSADAMRLSRAIDVADGPVDLRCIFRGMSNDASLRLDMLFAAQSAADQSRVYQDIASLMTDAQEIAPAADDANLALEISAPLICSATDTE